MEDQTTQYTEWRWCSPNFDEANHVLFMFGEGGFAPGNFCTKLIEAMVAADVVNLSKLALAYPGYASAVWTAQRSKLDHLRWAATAPGRNTQS